jgi:acyl-CoA synthetase (AMP-forming)/AMP-acid ligase II
MLMNRARSVRSPQNTPGCFRKPEETAATIDAEGWLHTGDIGSIDAEGYLTIKDRLKDMIITGGENVYPAEVEAILAEHSDIASVAVVDSRTTAGMNSSRQWCYTTWSDYRVHLPRERAASALESRLTVCLPSIPVGASVAHADRVPGDVHIACGQL